MKFLNLFIMIIFFTVRNVEIDKNDYTYDEYSKYSCKENNIYSDSCDLKENCENKIKSIECDYFTECLEKKFLCGENGYPLAIGKLFCEKSLQYFDEFDNEGQYWIQGSIPCIKHFINESINNSENSYSCDDIKTIAFSAYPKCFAEHGFCKLLPITEPEKLCKTIKGLLKIFDLRIMNDIEIQKEINTLLHVCRERGEEIEKLKLVYYALRNCNIY